MKETFKEIVIGYLKGLIPFLLTLLMVLIDFVPIHLPLSHFFRPDLAVVCVYFWVLYRIDLFGILSVIILCASAAAASVFVLMPSVTCISPDVLLPSVGILTVFNVTTPVNIPAE